ncbi:hypothetical protein acsn021_06000 [Anaerocolumna cellulosilytica]|jgi:hypothetical protein|uniref:Uncharacterized protein n=1 Tax=Anaerocolumna cellulosilytica TaxID=433286 RepID=A0A6S6R1C8_9FIRM|nr:membrane-associated protease 1 [Anaerocolumna cellulosilytica]MBB5197757.1 hypothetical protein [Anaerocolumna cellulosilytica]BCJ93031.1 hypothetical protein acsn021_06000 [Anaerocolumna cellulosilytica]
MGFRIKIEGGTESIELGLQSLTQVKFETDTPNDSNARSTDVGMALAISGKILTAVDGDEADATLKLANWSLVPAEKADCYRKVTVEVIAAEQVVREIYLSNAFVVDYKESYGDTEGVGTFKLLIRQKKDKNNLVEYKGGFGLQ